MIVDFGSRPNLEYYKYYKENCTDYKPVDVLTFFKIFYGFVKYMLVKLFAGYDIKLGSNDTLGTLCIRGKRYNAKINKEDNTLENLPIDWGNSRKIWAEKAKERGQTLKEFIDTTTKEERQKAYHFNDHSDGITYNILWLHKEGHLDKYNFIPTVGPVGIGRKLKKEIVEGGREYLEVERKVNLKKKSNGQVKTS